MELDAFVNSRTSVVAAWQANSEAARAFIARAAGGFFDGLDLDRDGALELAGLEAFAAAYGHPVDRIAANLEGILNELDLPAGRLPRAAFLNLVEQC